MVMNDGRLFLILHILALKRAINWVKFSSESFSEGFSLTYLLATEFWFSQVPE